MLWDTRRPLPAYAKTFCEMIAKHVQQAFPHQATSPARLNRAGALGGKSDET